MRSAAEQVNVLEFIRGLPDGFDHSIRERGSGLSTGQKQLISFARALAHNPRYLILDEATSSVDTDTEFRVRAALMRMVEGRTSIVIAHRLSTIQRADRILVMHKGATEGDRDAPGVTRAAGDLLEAVSVAVQGSGAGGELEKASTAIGREAVCLAGIVIGLAAVPGRCIFGQTTSSVGLKHHHHCGRNASRELLSQ
ncbi:MAG: ATP-binding cassette domain-containing protein [Ignavibacteriota bacterium]